MSALLTAQHIGVQVREARAWLPILHDVSLSIQAGEMVGLVGQSGSGKSTLARALLRLMPLSHGCVQWQGHDLARLSEAHLRALRPSYQAIFQQPSASLSPRLTVFRAIAEPLGVHAGRRDRVALRRNTLQAMADVGLSEDLGERLPHQLSGGQCQRVAIARALINQPRLLICDEIVSALDLSVQAQVLNLMMRRCRELGTAVLFISHDLAVVRRVSDRVMVMQSGRLIEVASTEQLFSDPQHPYTRQLIAASS
jgi:oligopeptide transport system ATP-binding protein